MDNWKEKISQSQYEITVEKDVFVPMRDGVKLAIDIYRPDAEGKFPALLAMGGYGKELQDLLIAPQPMKKSAVWDGNIEAGDTPEIVPRGYVHVIADNRGTGISEGEFQGMWTQQEGQDGYDLIEWIAQQPWCDGNVGMIGYSYYGKIQLKVAIEQPPHLKAIFVSHVVSDFYREQVYPGGVLSLFLYGLWDGRHGTSGFAPKNPVSQMVKTLPKEEFESRREALLNHPDIRNFPNMYHLLKYPYKNPQFFDCLMNPLDGPFWQTRSVYPFFDKINIPVHVVGKTPHTAQGYWSVFNGLNTTKKLLVKPGEPEERPWREDIELIIRWYDHWLKGNDTGMMDEPPMKIWTPGEHKWRYADQFPPADTEWVDCYLRRWEGLTFSPELHQPEPDYYLHLPLHLSNKRDWVQYVSPVLPETMEMMGPAALKLYAAIDQDDTNWIAHLFDVAPGGMEIRIARGFLKASHRAIDPDKSKPYAPYHTHASEDLVVPGEIYEYNISLGNLVYVFKPGHRIKLVIDSRESPRDPEMQIHFHPHLCSSKPTLHKIYRNKTYPSRLILPIRPQDRAITEMLGDDNLL